MLEHRVLLSAPGATGDVKSLTSKPHPGDTHSLVAPPPDNSSVFGAQCGPTETNISHTQSKDGNNEGEIHLWLPRVAGLQRQPKRRSRKNTARAGAEAPS